LTFRPQRNIIPGMNGISADAALEELAGAPAKPGNAVAKLSYTHDALVDLIMQHPEMTQNQLAARFGYTPGWISRVIASDAFQVALARRRDEIIDPAIKATIEERFKALVVQSLEVLMNKLSAPVVSDNVALRAAELGAKALGLGGHALPVPPKPQEDRLIRLAERLVDLQSNVRKGEIINGSVSRVEVEE
jgi:hypothetical protein